MLTIKKIRVVNKYFYACTQFPNNSNTINSAEQFLIILLLEENFISREHIGLLALGKIETLDKKL